MKIVVLICEGISKLDVLGNFADIDKLGIPFRDLWILLLLLLLFNRGLGPKINRTMSNFWYIF